MLNFKSLWEGFKLSIFSSENPWPGKKLPTICLGITFICHWFMRRTAFAGHQRSSHTFWQRSGCLLNYICTRFPGLLRYTCNWELPLVKLFYISSGKAWFQSKAKIFHSNQNWYLEIFLYLRILANAAWHCMVKY